MPKGEHVGASPVIVRDTRDIPCDPAFEVFREAVSKAAVPYSLEQSYEGIVQRALKELNLAKAI